MLCPIGGLSARQFNSCMSAPKRREEEKSYAVVRWLGGWLAGTFVHCVEAAKNTSLLFDVLLGNGTRLTMADQ